METGLINHAALDAVDLTEPSAAASTVSSGGVSILIQEMVVFGLMTWPCTAATIAAKRDDICRYGTRTGRSRCRKIAIRSTFLLPDDTRSHDQNLLPKQAVAGSSPVPRSQKIGLERPSKELIGEGEATVGEATAGISGGDGV
jgi:hypothetical protein